MTFHMQDANHRQKLIDACKNLKNEANELNQRILKLLDMANIDSKILKLQKTQTQRFHPSSKSQTMKKLNKKSLTLVKY